jgi:cytosine/adenosine deaminase-related metal-dependent hydrolase
MPRIIDAAIAIDAAGPLAGPQRISIENGVIAAVEPLADAAGSGHLVLPAIANAHDHARPVRASSIGSFGKPLETWLHRLQLFEPVDPYLAAAAAFGRAALGGQGAAMVHYTRPWGPMALPEEAAEVARAARDVGIRIAFGVAMRDANPLVYGDPDPVLGRLSPETRAEIEGRFLGPLPSVATQMALVDAVAERAAGPMVDVQYAPNGVQWCSTTLLEAIAEGSARTGRRITTHLLETRYQRDWADAAFPGGLVRHLHDIGFLSPRTTLAHCTWARPDELEIIAESGATIAVNTSSNLALRSGIAPVHEMLRRGCRVALGVDGQAFDEDDDAIREMRLLWSLQAGWGFDEGVTTADALHAALAAGRPALGAPGTGRIAPGEPADLLVLDWARLDEDALMEVEPVGLLFSRATGRHVGELVVAGRTVAREGRVLGIDLDAVQAELRAAFRAGLPSRRRFACALPELEDAIRDFYAPRMGCC